MDKRQLCSRLKLANITTMTTLSNYPTWACTINSKLFDSIKDYQKDCQFFPPFRLVNIHYFNKIR